MQDELASHKQLVVVIDQDQQRVDVARAAGHLVLLGDATEEETLRLAGLEQAKALVTVLPNDAANWANDERAGMSHKRAKVHVPRPARETWSSENET